MLEKTYDPVHPDSHRTYLSTLSSTSETFRLLFALRSIQKYTKVAAAPKHVAPMHIAYPLRYVGASLAKKQKVATMPPVFPKLMIQAVPMLRLLCPCRFMTNQQMMMGPPAKAPMVTRHTAAYWMWKLLWTLKRMPRPANVRALQKIRYGERRRVRSDR